MNKYKLKTNDTLKCSACGNKEFEEKQVDMTAKMQGIAGQTADMPRECWMYVCTDCGHVMAFTERASVKEGIL